MTIYKVVCFIYIIRFIINKNNNIYKSEVQQLYSIINLLFIGISWNFFENYQQYFFDVDTICIIFNMFKIEKKTKKIISREATAMYYIKFFNWIVRYICFWNKHIILERMKTLLHFCLKRHQPDHFRHQNFTLFVQRHVSCLKKNSFTI